MDDQRDYAEEAANRALMLEERDDDALCPHGFYSEGCGDCQDTTAHVQLFARRMALVEAGALERADSGCFIAHQGSRPVFLCDFCDDERARVVLADSGFGGFVSVNVCDEHIERAL